MFREPTPYRGDCMIPEQAECVTARLLSENADGGISMEFEYRTPTRESALIAFSFSAEALAIMINIPVVSKIYPKKEPGTVELMTDGYSAVFSELELGQRLFARLHRYGEAGVPMPQPGKRLAGGKRGGAKTKKTRSVAGTQ